MKARMTPMLAQLKEGIYNAVVLSIEPQVGNFGEYLRWSFTVHPPKSQPTLVTGLTSCIFSKRSKLYDWAKTITGQDFQVNEELDTDHLVGASCRLWLVIKPLEDGSINAIKEVLPPEEAVMPQPSADDDVNPFGEVDEEVPF